MVWLDCRLRNRGWFLNERVQAKAEAPHITSVDVCEDSAAGAMAYIWCSELVSWFSLVDKLLFYFGPFTLLFHLNFRIHRN